MKNKKSKQTKSTRALREAVKTLLLKKKDINAITVMELSKEANVNRGTFYNHYNNINDIINEIEDEIMEEFDKIWHKAETSGSFADSLMQSVTTTFIKYQNEYSEIVKYIPHYTYTDLKTKILKAITDNYERINPDDQKTMAELYILSNGIAACYIEYFQEKLNVNLNELSKTSATLIKRVITK